MPVKNSYTFALSPDQQEKLLNLLGRGNFRPVDVPHTRMAVLGDNVNISLYKSGKCVVQGKGATDWVTFHLEPEVLGEARLGYEDVHDPAAAQPHMGVDESGKGDFFGPLVIAAAYVNAEIVDTFRALNVRDSKTITSDKVAEDMADKIAEVLGRRFAIVTIGPAAYNRMYGTMKNVNAMLAWGHARAIEDLLGVVPDCPRALSDQFGPTHRIERALMEKGKRITLDQRPKAESDPAVAAASVLARAGFLRAMRDLGNKFGVKLPKGASAQTQQAAVELIAKHGPEVLLETCKGHFRTADEVLAKAGHSRVEVPNLPASNPTPYIRRKSSRPS
ncbi:MAG TPA: ribonuclease HIII [Kiritimatiellia bacterium]|nr:ribonuclease HIII [Kiritimatiellia bacterium]HMO99213.1 ribonuclease HIII [Kiritimatiellia bacterium]HMP96004.1 ribonuclease HIII [Kiritimatiellia bacterium]